MGNTFTAPIFRLMHWFDRRAMTCTNCKGAVPQGRRNYCTDACENDYQDAMRY